MSAQRNAGRNAGRKARSMKSDIPISVLESAFGAGVCLDRTCHETCSVVGVCERCEYRSNLHGTRSAPVASKKAPREMMSDQLAPQLSSCTAACCAAPLLPPGVLPGDFLVPFAEIFFSPSVDGRRTPDICGRTKKSKDYHVRREGNRHAPRGNHVTYRVPYHVRYT